MKKIKKVLLLILIAFSLIWFVSCDKTDVSKEEDEDILEPIVPETAVSKLNDIEKAIYDGIIYSMDYLKDPSSVKFIRVVKQFFGDLALEVTISARNSFGNDVFETYVVFTRNESITKKMYDEYGGNAPNSTVCHNVESGTMFDVDTCIDMYNQTGIQLLNTPVGCVAWLYNTRFPVAYEWATVVVSSAKINNAVQEYKIEQGWL